MLLHALLLALAAPRGYSGLHTGTVRIPPTVLGLFDPNHPETKQRLMAAFGIPAFEASSLSGNVGMNGGVWTLSDTSGDGAQGDMVLKLRLPEPAGSILPSEAELLVSLAREHPQLANDTSVAFPSAIFGCLDSQSRHIGDLILARKAPGQMLAYLIADKYYEEDQSMQELEAVFEDIGRQLRAFHGRYGRQHNDFHTANIIVDSAADGGHRVTFVDMAGMALPSHQPDREHFAKAVRMLAASYPPASDLERCYECFELGYQLLAGPPPQAAEASAAGPGEASLEEQADQEMLSPEEAAGEVVSSLEEADAEMSE